MKPKVLIIEDDAGMRELLTGALGRRGFESLAVAGAEAGLKEAAARAFDVVLTDLNLGGMNGIELCERLGEVSPGVPVIVITAFGTLDSAVSAMRAGAWDFITKPIDMDTLGITLGRAVEQRRLRVEVARLRATLDELTDSPDLIGESEGVRGLKKMLSRVADKPVNVLVTGEPGVGKEVVARALHRMSRWRDGPFVDVNCAAIPETMLESELFGHVKGAFTDAHSQRAGLLARAAGGTFFLDEVGDLSTALQPKLLRVLQERTFRPVGSDESRAFEGRLVAATNHDLEREVAEGRFREDLFYRLNVVRIEVPPLRARGNDVLLLAQRFITQAAERYGMQVNGMSPEAARALLGYSWPGNVRQLQHTIEQAVVMADHSLIALSDLPERMREPRVHGSPQDPNDLRSLEEVERQHILKVLEAVEGNRTVAAQILGLDRKTLYRKLDRFSVA